MKKVTTLLPNPESKPESRATFNCEPQKKASLLNLPNEILLNIADCLMEDYLAWKIGYLNNLQGDFDDLDPSWAVISHYVKRMNLAYVPSEFMFFSFEHVSSPEACLGSMYSLDVFQGSLYPLKEARLIPKSLCRRTHPILWNLLKGRKISDDVLERAKAKVKTRCEIWRLIYP